MQGLNFTLLRPPTDIPITGDRGNLTPEWRQFFNYFYRTFQNFQYTIPVPSLTQDQIDSLVGVANGWIVYNNTDNSFQGYVDGAWKTFTLT